jgi:hypothetical protein
MRKVTALSALVTLAAFPAAAQDPKAMQQKLNNLAHEHLICAAYANISAVCLIQKNGENDPAGQHYKELTGTLMERGFQIGGIAGVSFNASKARFEMANQEMMEKIEKNCSNFSILMQEHLDACVSLYNEGPARLRAISSFGEPNLQKEHLK